MRRRLLVLGAPAIALLAIALLATACTQDVPKSLGDRAAVTTPTATASALYTLRGPATLADGRLTLTSDRVAWFTDRPARRAGTIATGRLPEVWTSSGFDHDPPNAQLVIGDSSRTVELTDLRVSGGDVSFTARGVGRRLPTRAAGEADLFIDGGAFPPPVRFSNCLAAAQMQMVTASPDLSDQCDTVAARANWQLQVAQNQPAGQTSQLPWDLDSYTCTSPIAGTVACVDLQQATEDSGIAALQVTSWFVAVGPSANVSGQGPSCSILQADPMAPNQTVEVTFDSAGGNGLPPCAQTATLLAGLATIVPNAPGFTGGDTPVDVLDTNAICPGFGSGGGTLTCTGDAGPTPDPEVTPAFDQLTLTILP